MASAMMLNIRSGIGLSPIQRRTFTCEALLIYTQLILWEQSQVKS